ncbi:MAG: 8-amino-7-oxononanoate synthase [Gammaproteobacteria bacterium]|nr:8-amino-7-oxononanoate synthase [Gammaproteobacteria bacterium]
MSGFSDMDERLEALRQQEMYRHRRVLSSPQGRDVVIDGRRLLNFCSNDYLGLAADPRIQAAFKAGVDRWGTGSGASHLVCGHSGVHAELEAALAEFTGRPRALLFSSGYAANVGVINALLGAGDYVFEDRLNHASLVDGGRLSRAELHWYKHRDVEHLARKLTACDNLAARKLVVTDGTFSMDGDQAPLAELVPLVREQGAWLMIDDAHGFGALGRGGRGLVDAADWSLGDVPVLVGTLGKAFGTFGAFVAGSDALIETLIQHARNFIYTTALPPAVAAATLCSLDIVRTEHWRRDRLNELIERFRAGAAGLGLELLPSQTAIQPVVVGTPGRALALSRALEEAGLLVGAIRPPTVPKGSSRLRITFTAAHEPGDVDRLLDALGTAGRGIEAA